MALQGKFLVNNERFSPLTICGVGSFLAFSGNDIYRNRGGCTAIKDNGPIPAGRYWVVDRPSGGIGSRIQTWAKDTVISVLGTPTDHDEWFALYRDDGQIDDYTWVNGVERGNFRLHPIGRYGVSLGCITVQNLSDFQTIRRALLHTSTVPVRNTDLRAYAAIEVITNDNVCP
jgi:hypothetical protein